MPILILREIISVLLSFNSFTPKKKFMPKTPGRKRESFSLDKLIKNFVKYEKKIVLDNDKILRPKDVFWTELKAKYNIPGKEKNTYTDAWKWHQKGSKKDSEKNSDADDSLEQEMELNSSKDTTFSDNDEKSDKGDIKFSICVSKELWKLIEPVPRS